MISFTKRYVNIISLIISIIIFCFLNNEILNKDIQIQNFSVSSKIQQITNNLEEENNLRISEQSGEQQHESQPNNEGVANNENKSETINQSQQQENLNPYNAQNQPQESGQNVTNPVWQIEIPAINLKASIAEGTTKEIMDEFVGHFEETVKRKGNVGLAAHNRGYKVNYFQDLKKLKEGDEIIYKYKEFEKRYVVKTLKIISDEDWSWLENTEDNRITLITCVENEPQYRRLIQGVDLDANN